jgi:hypothetical protein
MIEEDFAPIKLDQMRKTEKHAVESAEVEEKKRKGLPVLAAENKPLKLQSSQRLFRRH